MAHAAEQRMTTAGEAMQRESIQISAYWEEELRAMPVDAVYLAQPAEDSDLGVHQAALLTLHEQKAAAVHTEIQSACQRLGRQGQSPLPLVR